MGSPLETPLQEVQGEGRGAERRWGPGKVSSWQHSLLSPYQHSLLSSAVDIGGGSHEVCTGY